jgi:hypothetical protein
MICMDVAGWDVRDEAIPDSARTQSSGRDRGHLSGNRFFGAYTLRGAAARIIERSRAPARTTSQLWLAMVSF